MAKFKENPKVALNAEQRKKLENIWFIYGNGGAKHSHSGHRFIQTFLENDGEDARKFFKPSKEVLEAVDAIIKS